MGYSPWDLRELDMTENTHIDPQFKRQDYNIECTSHENKVAWLFKKSGPEMYENDCLHLTVIINFLSWFTHNPSLASASCVVPMHQAGLKTKDQFFILLSFQHISCL